MVAPCPFSYPNRGGAGRNGQKHTNENEIHHSEHRAYVRFGDGGKAGTAPTPIAPTGDLIINVADINNIWIAWSP
jgi:hypothetical protein